MVRVGVLGNLEYHSPAHSWVLDLGASLSQLTVPDIDSREDKQDTIRTINRALRNHGISYNVPDVTKGEDLNAWEVLFDILALVEDKDRDRALSAFLLIGAADHFLELAASATSPDRIAELRRIARSQIDAIQHLSSEGINVNAAALYNLLAEPPHGAQPLRTKLQRASQPLVILFLAADPSDFDRRRLLDERRTLDELVKSSVVRDAFKVVDAPGCRIHDISQALLRHKPTLLHFSGHGTPEGFCFQDGSGEAAVVKPEAFAKLLALAHRNGLKGAVISASYSDTDPQLLANATGYAVAIEGPLSTRDANTFTREFYAALGSGRTFEEAFKWAVAGAAIDSNISALRPKLFKGEPDNTH